MISPTVATASVLPNTSAPKPLLPEQSLTRATMMRDRQGATDAVIAGANPMRLIRRAIEARQGHVDFLLLFIEADNKEHIESMASHLNAWGRYPAELAALEVWLAAH